MLLKPKGFFSGRACQDCKTARAAKKRRAERAEQKRLVRNYNRRQWAKKNRDKVNAKKALRRAILLRATPPWADRKALAAVYSEAAKKKLHVDHIMPLRARNSCGLHVPWNLQLLTQEANSRKGNRVEHEPVCVV